MRGEFRNHLRHGPHEGDNAAFDHVSDAGAAINARSRRATIT